MQYDTIDLAHDLRCHYGIRAGGWSPRNLYAPRIGFTEFSWIISLCRHTICFAGLFRDARIRHRRLLTFELGCLSEPTAKSAGSAACALMVDGTAERLHGDDGRADCHVILEGFWLRGQDFILTCDHR